MASIHDGWTPQPQEETMDERYTEMFLEGDDNAWWMLSSGKQWNLYEHAAARAEAAEARAAAADDVLGQTQAERDAAQAEAERLRAQVVTLEAQLQEVRTEYRVACDDFNELLEQTSDW